MKSLPLFHLLTGKKVVVLGDGDAGEAKRRLIRRAGGIPVGETEACHAKLGFVAMEDERAAKVAAIRLRRNGLLVNVADRPELCDFVIPSLLDRDPVLVAIGTSGASAGLAKALRLRLESQLPQSLGALAEALRAARSRMRERWPSAASRRIALDQALGEGGMLDPLRDQAASQVADWLETADEVATEERVEIVLTSDDPDDLTLRQARILGAADAVICESGVAPEILARVRADARRVSVGDDAAELHGRIVVLRRG